MDGTTAETVLTPESSVPEQDSDHNAPESSIPVKQTTDLSPIPTDSVTAAQPTTISEGLSSTSTVVPGPAPCRSEAFENNQQFILTAHLMMAELSDFFLPPYKVQGRSLQT